MIFFIVTIFIAQLIIVWNIVYFLLSLDNKINKLSLTVVSYNEILPELMLTTKEMTSDIKDMIPLIYEKFIRQRNKLIWSEVKTVLESLALVTFKPKYKKLLVGIRVGVRLIKKLIKQKNML